MSKELPLTGCWGGVSGVLGCLCLCECVCVCVCVCVRLYFIYLFIYLAPPEQYLFWRLRRRQTYYNAEQINWEGLCEDGSGLQRQVAPNTIESEADFRKRAKSHWQLEPKADRKKSHDLLFVVGYVDNGRLFDYWGYGVCTRGWHDGCSAFCLRSWTDLQVRFCWSKIPNDGKSLS